MCVCVPAYMCLHGCVRVCWGHGITGTSECVAVCCSVLQYVAVCCNVLQYFAVFCSAALCCSVLRCVAVLHCVAVCCRHTCICIFACSTAILYCSFLLIFPYPVSAPSSFHSGGTGAALYPPPPPPPPHLPPPLPPPPLPSLPSLLFSRTGPSEG